MKPSLEQEAVFSWVASATGNAIVDASAGSGKTTTLVQALRHMKGTIAFMAYNKKAADEIKAKCEAEGLAERATCGTVHSFGYGVLRSAGSYPKPDEWERWNTLAEKFGIGREHTSFFKSFLSMAKQRAIGVTTPIRTPEAWLDMADTFSLWDDLPDELSKEGALALCYNLLQAAKFNYQKVIDFDDMIWLPLALGLQPKAKFDWVLLDEAQDTNPARRELVKLLLKPTGRLLAVGDPAQAIYGFTGADNDALKTIEKEFSTTHLPLYTSFRCAKAIIREAQIYVPHIKAFDQNPEGTIYEVNSKENDFTWTDDVASSDVILCRYTRPLIRLAFHFIRQGRAAKVEGRKIGEGLKALAKKLKFDSRVEFARELSAYQKRELEILLAKKKNLSASTLKDKVDSLFVIADSMENFSKEKLITKIDSIFDDKVSGITLMTIHRSKGLEWPTIWWYGPQYSPSFFASQEWELEQERNLCYVAITRAKSTLKIVNLEKEPR